MSVRETDCGRDVEFGGKFTDDGLNFICRFAAGEFTENDSCGAVKEFCVIESFEVFSDFGGGEIDAFNKDNFSSVVGAVLFGCCNGKSLEETCECFALKVAFFEDFEFDGTESFVVIDFTHGFNTGARQSGE